MTQKFFSFNYMRQSLTTFSVNSNNANFPTSNLKDHRSSKVVRTETGTTTMNLVVDIGSTELVNSVLIEGDKVQNGLGFTGDITIEANATDSGWGTPAFSTTLTPNTTYGIGIKTFADQNYRYWRITASTSGNYVEFSNLFLGESISLTTSGINNGFSLSTDDSSKIVENRYLQYFADVGIQRRKLDCSYAVLNPDEMETLLNMFRYHGTTEPLWFYVCNPETSSTNVNNEEDFFFQGRLKSIPSIRNTSAGYYNTSFQLVEVI